MIPRSRRAALLEILAAERKVKALALESYRQWLPVARARVLGTVTAAADTEPPDPDAVAQTGADWEAILAGVFLPGLAQLVFAQLAADLTALGVSAADVRGLIEAAARAARPDGSRAPADGAPRPGRTTDTAPTPEPAEDPRWADEREAEERAEQQRQADERDADRQADRDRDAARRRAEQRQADERRERDRQAAERQAAQRRERERRDAERREQQRQADEQRDAQEEQRAQQEAQRREQERRDAEQREQARREQARQDADADTERARRDEERRAEQQREQQRRDAEEAEQARQQQARRAAEERAAERRADAQRERDRQEAERREAALAERERRDAERREQQRQADELEAQARAEQARLEAEQRDAARQADADREAQRQEQARQEAERREQEEQAEPEASDTSDPDRDRDDDNDVDLTPRIVADIPGAADYVDDYLAVVRNRMVRTPDTAFRLIAAELAEAVRLGESPQQQRDRVARVLDAENLETFGGRRAALVARTETCGALNAARLEAGRVWAEITGEQMEKAWLATIDARTRDTHFAVDGQRVPLAAEFVLPNAVKMLYPGEPGAPAAEVCNCRCALMILAPDEELPDEDDRQTERGPGDANVRNREGTRQDEIDRRKKARGIVRARDDPDGVGQINAAAGAPPPERIPAMRKFTAVLAHLGERTDDGRLLDTGMDLRFRATPLPLRWQRQDLPEHMEAFTVAAITDISRDGTKIIGSGYMLDTPEAAEAIVQIEAGVTNPSVDLADVEWEIRDQDGRPVDLEAPLDEGTKLVFTMTSAIVTAATLVSIPAFGTTSITLAEESDEDTDDQDEDAESVAAALVAAAVAPYFKPSAHMFEDPGLTEPTPLHQTDDGRIIGHLAVWGTCHVGIPDRCVTPPHSETDYAHFHTSSVVTADGTRLPVGRLTVGTGHAKHSLGANAAAEHYDNTGTCWAYVRTGEDEIGPWVSGVVHPDATDRQVREGLSAPLSGDWRSIGGNLELVAALSVNTPGFPVVSGRYDEHGLAASLIASLSPRQSRPPAAPSVLRTIAQETAQETVREFRQAEVRRSRALALIEQRRATTRQTQAAELIAAVRGRS